MVNNSGWIKLHRKITDWEWYDDMVTFKLFIHLLLTANHEDKKWKGVLIKRGSLVTGRIELSKRLGVSEQSIRTSLTKLKSTNELTIKTTNKYSVVSINNYDAYQQDNQQINQRATNKQPTTNHKQEYKNIRIKEDKNIYTSLDSLTENDFQDIANQYRVKVSDVKSLHEELDLYCKSTGKKYKDYKASLQNWTRRKIADKKLIPSVQVAGSITKLIEEERKKHENLRHN